MGFFVTLMFCSLKKGSVMDTGFQMWGVWQDIERPGYLGKHREERFKEWTEKYGRDGYGELNWRLVWRFGDATLDFLGACRVYEDAYFKYLRENPLIVDQLVAEASDVYDDEPSNVGCGLDYTKQETGRTHVQDISIRSCLVRMGRWFKGKELIRIRQEKGNHPLSMTLSPGRVPFHIPGMIVAPSVVPKWAEPGSVEDFYQSNRYLQARTHNPFDKPVEHVCGAVDFGYNVDDVCPACEVARIEREKKQSNP